MVLKKAKVCNLKIMMVVVVVVAAIMMIMMIVVVMVIMMMLMMVVVIMMMLMMMKLLMLMMMASLVLVMIRFLYPAFAKLSTCNLSYSFFIQDAFNEVVGYFGENPKTLPPSAFFALFHRFSVAFKVPL